MFDRCLFNKRYPLDRWSAQYRLPSPKLAQQLRIKSGNLSRRTAIGYEKYMYANQSNKGVWTPWDWSRDYGFNSRTSLKFSQALFTLSFKKCSSLRKPLSLCGEKGENVHKKDTISLRRQIWLSLAQVLNRNNDSVGTVKSTSLVAEIREGESALYIRICTLMNEVNPEDEVYLKFMYRTISRYVFYWR